MRVDAHQHFWRPERGDYGWLDHAPAALRRTFGPQDLAADLRAQAIYACVLVQAAPTVEETHYLLGIADATPFVAGVVGWIDFEAPAQRAQLERLAAHPALVGLRPMVQDIHDDEWVLSRGLQWAFDALQSLGLCFDALGLPRHAPHLLALAERHPGLRIVLDHGLKPAIRDGAFDAWARDIRMLADHTQAMCKLSGLVTEAGTDPSPERLRPYVQHLLECFGPGRLIWGSDWPVLLASQSYGAWMSTCESLLNGCSDAERAQIFGLNAAGFYKLERSQARG